MRLANVAIMGSRDNPNSTRATAVPISPRETNLSAPIMALIFGKTKAPPTAPTPIAPSKTPYS